MNKFVVFLAIMMVMTLVFSMAAVPVFADGADTAEVVDDAADTAEVVDDTEADEHDHDGDGVADHETTTDDGWTVLDMSDYIALVVAAVILVAFIVAIVLFVPKKTKQR